MNQSLLKITSLLLLLLVIGGSLSFILYPRYSEFKILSRQFESTRMAHNTTLNFFSKISQPAIAGVADVQNEDGQTVEYISDEVLEEHRSRYGLVNLEDENTRLIIESADIDGNVVDGDDATSMDRGFWHYPLSSIPGHRGNTIVIGHRFLHIPPRTDTFFNLDQVKIGDKIEIQQDHNSYSYTVIHTFVVDKTNISVLENTNDYRITLITCTPLWSSEERLIVVGKMDRVYGNI